MSEVSVPDQDKSDLSGSQWFLRGMKGIVSIPAFILMMSFVGFGGLSAEAGLTTAQAMFLALSTWALPSAVVVVGATLNDVPFYATVFAVTLAAIRLMPMTMALLPLLRSDETKTWHLILASHFVAITAWVYTMNAVHEIPRRGRLPFFLGLGLSLALVNTMITGVSHAIATTLPPIAAAALLFLTPVYFLISMTQAVRVNSEYVAIGLGLVLGPLFHLFVPETDLLWCGIIGGTLAYAAGRLFGKSAEGTS